MANTPNIIQDERLRDLYRYWADKKHGRALPARGDLDPMEIPQLLPNIGLVDVVGDPPRFRYRLVGTAITHAIGRELTGRFVDELPIDRDYVEHLLSLYRTTLEERRPVYSEGDFIGLPYKASWRSFRLLLPLSRRDDRVDMILVGQIFTEAAGEEDDDDERGGVGNRVIMVLD
jgi:hypothetical protein